MYIYGNNSVETNDRVLRLHKTGFTDVAFQVCRKVTILCKGCHKYIYIYIYIYIYLKAL